MRFDLDEFQALEMYITTVNKAEAYRFVALWSSIRWVHRERGYEEEHKSEENKRETIELYVWIFRKNNPLIFLFSTNENSLY